MTSKPKKTLGVPESHSDVVNRQPTCLLIGYGWVGQHVHKYFTNANWYTPEKGLQFARGGNVAPYNPTDENGLRAKEMLDAEGIKKWDIAFINVPTPMLENGRCDTSIVEKSVEMWKDYVDLFVIRSTVEPGTTNKLAEKYGVRIVMQPEYVGETLGHPMLEPRRDIFLILGGKPKDTALAAKYWSLVLHADCKIRQVNAKTAEFCKYMENDFLGEKVVFVNQWSKLAENDPDVDFLTLREAWLDDPRINRSHTLAYTDNPGFSGKCLPKDLNAICHYAREQGQPLHLTEMKLILNAFWRGNLPNNVRLLPKDKKRVEKWLEDYRNMIDHIYYREKESNT